MKKITFLIVLVGLSFYTKAQVVDKKPKEPLTKNVNPGYKNPGSIWVDGHWKWNGKTKSYEWIKGGWIKEKKGKKYKKGHWQKVKNGYKWIPGKWVKK